MWGVLVDTRYFFVFSPDAYTNKSESFPTRELATYSCLCEKHGFSKSSLHTCIDCSCALSMINAKASHTGNCANV